MAYDFLHKIIPDLYNGNISSLAQMCYEYRFNMRVIKNYSFVYPEIQAITYKLRELYDNKHCLLLSASSTGPAFFALVNNQKDKNACLKKMRELDMVTIEASVYNQTYKVSKT